MPTDETRQRHERLIALLAPLHDRARATARRLCRSNADGDDLFHEAVLRAFDRLDDLREPEKFRAWFYAILLSVHRARHRTSFWRRLLPFDDAGPDAPAPSDIDALEGHQRMSRALATLSPEAREAIVLFEIDGFSLDEIASLQKQSLSAIKSRLVRARARLRLHYERTEGAPRPLPQEKPS